METKIINRSPESGVRCSEITLTVRIVYERPFVAPGEWYHEDILRQVVNECNAVGCSNSPIQTWDINCTAHAPWVELQSITYSIGHGTPQLTTSREDELEYRDYCRSNWRDPSQSRFFKWILRTKHGIGIVTPAPAQSVES